MFCTHPNDRNDLLLVVANGSGGYTTNKGLIIGNAFDAGKTVGVNSVSDDRNPIIWSERGLDLFNLRFKKAVCLLCLNNDNSFIAKNEFRLPLIL